MISKVRERLPEARTLYEILPKGTEGGKEFARIIDLLLFHEARRSGKKSSIFSDVAGDYHGLDSFFGDIFRKEGTTGYQYKFYPSPLSAQHRKDIIETLENVSDNQKKLKIKKWILVTPQDLIESSTRKDGGDVTWFEGLRTELRLDFELEHWGDTKILALFLETPSICLFYYPEFVVGGSTRKKTIKDIRERYDEDLTKLYRDIQFVGMSVYKPEATKGVPMEHIYIPLTVIPEAADEKSASIQRINPLTFIEDGSRCIILGDPGSGKSTLLRFLALAGISKPLQKRYKAKPDKRLPIYVTLRRYADELKSRPNLPLIDYIQELIHCDFNLKIADFDFFEYYLETGQTILFFDGLDELPGPHFKQIVRDRIRTLITTYPGNTTLVTSRIVGYDNPFRFDEKEFKHYRVTKLQLPEIEQFVNDWYSVRIENQREREANVNDLIRIFRDESHIAIRELAENPLLLTIVALVHRIDAVLPDERVVLYQKCTETLLNTWHTWKFRELEVKNKGKIERRNRRRMESIAAWMQHRSISAEKSERAVVTYTDICTFLTQHIADLEKSDPENEPEDLANDFLEFIKKRAGLLIEVGDNQYSFVHLTFQEYLTSTHIITSCEKEGAEGIWKSIKEYCNNSKWHEVIRLLAAGLKSDESQRFLIEHILSEKANGHYLTKSQLLGGLLLDGIEPAEDHTDEILTQLILSGNKVNDIKQLRPVISMLRTWILKERAREERILSVFYSLAKMSCDNKQKETLILIASAINLNETKISELARELLNGKEHFADLYCLFFTQPSDIETFPSLKPYIQLLIYAQHAFSLNNPHSNFIAATCQSVTFPLGLDILAKSSFEQQLVALSWAQIEGPFGEFTLNSLLIALNDSSQIYKWAQSMPQGFRNPRKRKSSDRDIIQRTNSLRLAQKRIRGDPQDSKHHAYARVLKMARDLGRDINIESTPDPFNFYPLSQVKSLNANFWQNVLISPELYTPILDLLCDIFALEPHAQWWEALRVRFLPQIPQRITIFNETLWKKIVDVFEKGNPNETEIYLAAWQLLFDAWLYTFGYYKSPDDSIFGHLAGLTCKLDFPPLRIAHCIRDIAYGDKSRINDLVLMTESTIPQYREIFEQCLWIRISEKSSKIAKKD